MSRKLQIRWKFLALLCLVLSLLGCAGGGDEDPFDKLITHDTDLYQTGLNDAVTERRIEAGTRIRVTGISGDGKMQVETMSGDKGFVDRDAVGDAPENTGSHNIN